jgi:hypothetical protein
MNEEKLNISTRKLLKNVGVNSQRIIETSIRNAVNSGKIVSSKNIIVSISLKIKDLNIEESISGEIEIEI